jgi:ABC-type enterochelin transport system permease subunit
LCIAQGIATCAIDLNRTHATNLLWSRHARFHLVWQTLTSALLALLECSLLCWPGGEGRQRFYLAVVLVSIPLVAFLIACAAKGKFGGALSDPNGIRPVQIKMFGEIVHVDMNFVAVAAAVVAVGAIAAIYAL